MIISCLRIFGNKNIKHALWKVTIAKQLGNRARCLLYQIRGSSYILNGRQRTPLLYFCLFLLLPMTLADDMTI